MALFHRVQPGERLRLSEVDPDHKGSFSGKGDPAVAAELAVLERRMVDLQEKLYAGKRHGLLVVLQAMDTAGKDGVLRRVVGPLDSRGVTVHSFKAPNSEELAHDYLWRVHQKTPRRGEIIFFNRSHYEDVLVVRVLDLVPKEVWRRRFDHLNAFEQMLTDEDIKVVKIFLHISKDEQKRRLEERLRDPEKRWKWDDADLKMRAYWEPLIEAYEEVFARTSTEAAPWHVVPANRKWVRDLAVARILVDALEELRPDYPRDRVVPDVVIPD